MTDQENFEAWLEKMSNEIHDPYHAIIWEDGATITWKKCKGELRTKDEIIEELMGALDWAIGYTDGHGMKAEYLERTLTSVREKLGGKNEPNEKR